MIGDMKRKLKSQCGASLLLALLFLLVCMVVASSVLMASVSNAGKNHSNLEEHQRYLAISSAVNALCDELNRAEYRGRYEYTEIDKATVDADTGIDTFRTAKQFRQLDGGYWQKGTETQSNLSPLLLADFDAIFSEEIQRKLDEDEFETFYCKDAKPGAVLSHTLSISPQTGTAIDDQSVKITLTVMRETYTIELKAALENYQMQAELTPVANKPTLPPALQQGEQKTEPMQWEIGWITVGEEEAEP